jgi:16S rRNA (adenine1518-N6/adenine1519-N6)-dimethyltransferase
MTKANKELGQHWLHDTATLNDIVKAGSIEPGDTVLEIGPGLGTLTEKLAATGATIIALEYDQNLLPGLQKKFLKVPQVQIVQGDIRTFDLSQLSSRYKVVANIPYYLTSYLIRLLSETVYKPDIAVLLVQKEVAERVCARPGSMSVLSVVAQWHFESGLGIEVPPSLFTPPPTVDSQVVILRKRPEQLYDVDEKSFHRLIKAGFGEKRKTLRNALSGGLAITKEHSEELLRAANIEPGRRAQELTLDEWYALYCAVWQAPLKEMNRSKKQIRRQKNLVKKGEK